MIMIHTSYLAFLVHKILAMSPTVMATSFQHSVSTRYNFFFIFPLLFSPFACPLSLDISSFKPGANDMLYEGDATPSNGAVELTPINLLCRVGRASYAEGVCLWDSSTGTLADFTTHFSFTIVNPTNASPFSDGFAFFLASLDYPIPPNSNGGYLGLVNSSTSRNQVVFVEFDTFVNSNWDPPMTHVGINDGSVASLNYSVWDVNATSGKAANVGITYNATTKKLSVFWTYENDVLIGNSTSYNINLMEILPEWVRVGFSAATGRIIQRNIINSWQFSSSLDSRRGTKSRKEQMRKTIAIVVGAVGLSLLMLGVGTGYFLVKRRTKNPSRDGHENITVSDASMNLEKGALPKRFSFQELVMATNNFADHRRLGQGGSGHVYKGMLNDLGRLVAVKRIFTESVNSEKIFINEVKIISRLIHRNLVQFIGWCHEQGNFLLVYVYMPNGSLDTHLFGNRRPLPWDVRYRIALGLASALHYLHEEAEQCVIHRDIKSANILLDTDFSTKLGDFGVAKLVDPRLRTQMTGLVGTLGYLAPEYISEGRASKESDMFSFGVVALEIACGRRTYQHEGIHVPLAKWVWQFYLAGNILDAADERLSMDFDRDRMECLLTVGLWCSQPKDKQRPKAAQVIKVLQLEAFLPQLPNDMHDHVFSSPSSPPLQNESVVPLMSSSLDHHGR